MDLIVELMKDTYLLRPEAIEQVMEDIWKKYQKMLDESTSVEDLWEARVYLYVLGYLYPEKFGLEAIERRLKYLKEPMTLVEFLDTVDKDVASSGQRSDPLFVKLEKLYRAIRKYKQLVKNNSYLDEKRFDAKELELLGDKDERSIALGF